MKLRLLRSVAALFLLTGAAERDGVETELQRLVSDYQRDPSIEDVTFGVEVEGRVWTVIARRGRDGSSPSAVLTPGEPQVPAMVWTMGRETFRRIVSGQWSAMTASGAAFATDVTPLSERAVNGFRFDENFLRTTYRSLIFHFWTTGLPERVRFGFDQARAVHGGQAVPTFYGPGLRTAWYGILPGQHINADPRSQTDPWSSLFFVVRGGSARARVGGVVIDLHDRMMLHVPPNTRHEFWNPGLVPAEMIMVTAGQES